MCKLNFARGICAIAAMVVASATNAWGQIGQEYASNYLAEGQAGVGSSQPDFSALPPPQDYSNADLAKRIEDLEKQLGKYAKAAEANKPKSEKPLVMPSGRIQMDVANFTQNTESIEGIGPATNSVGFRRARLALLGGYETVDYIIEMDFANRGEDSLVNTKDQSTGFKDVFIQMRDLPVLGNVRVGHFKECFGLEDLTSDNYTTFMERSLDDEGTFCPGRNNGIMAYNWTENQRATWAIGTFTNHTGYDQPPLFVFDQWGLDLAMRGTFLPWYDEASGGRGYLHTGVGYVYRSAPNHTMKLATRPESAFAPAVVNMKFTDLIDMNVVGTEAALVYGPFSIQSEFFASHLDREAGVQNNFYGTYVYVSYFLTGENRPYNRKLGVFDRVRPYENFFRVRTTDGDVSTGRGAWEVAYRFSYIDMLDGLTMKGAGLATDHTVGLNWYLNPYTKLMFNYVHSDDTYNPAAGTTVTGGELNIVEMRCAMDF